MTGRYFISSQYEDSTKKTTNRYRLYLERNDLDSSLLGPLKASHISFGDINTASIQNLPSGGADVGVRVSNRPYGRITNSATTNFSGFQQPDWEVELYHDDIFIESVVVQADGMYQFLDVPLNAGENIFKLKFYGPQGQEEEKVEIRNLDQASLVGGDWIYDFSVSKQNTSLANILEGKNTYEDDQYRVNLHLEKGIGNNFSLTADYTNYDFDDGTNHNFVQAGARFYLLNTVFNLNHLRDLDAGGLSSFSLARRLGPNSNHSFSYSARHESEDFAVNSYSSSNFKLNQNANLSGPLTSYPGFRSRYSLGTSWSENYDGNTSQNYNLGLAATIYRWSLSNNLYASKARRHGDFRLGTYYGRLNLRAGLTYDLKPESELDSGNIHLGWTFSNDLRINYDYGYRFTTSADSHRVNLSWFNKYFVTSFSVARDSEGIVTSGLHVKFSLVPDPLRNRLHMSSRGLANTGAVSALVFEDLNNNQVWDEGEPIIENAEVVGVQQRKRDFTDKDGKAFVTGLSPTIPVDIEVNTDSLEDPFWMPSKEGVSFLPRAGLIKTVHIPIVTGGEIEGKVIYRTDITHSGVEQGGIPLLLTNTASGETLETQTVFDGYFLLDKVKPGNYLLTINQNYLQKNKLATRSPMPLTIGNNGSLIMGANFEVFPADLYQAKPEEVFENEAFWVDLGAFSSENNAKTVANALRLVFSRILSLRSSPKPVEIVLAKDSAEMYQLKLGPLTNINDSKEICGALVQEGLYCKVEKIDLDIKTPNKPASSITPTTKLANPPTQSTSPSNENRPDDKTAILAKGLEWVKTQNSSSYTLQLSNSLNYEGAKYSLDQLKSNTAYIIEQKNNNQITYSLILGSFPTREDAMMQASNLSFNTPPWIRSFEGLKENLIESQ